MANSLLECGRQCPGQPRVDGAEAQVPLPAGVEHVEQGGDLGGRRVGRHPDPLSLEHQARPDGPQVLPADGGTDRLAGGPVPHDGRRPLVGDADALDRPAGVQRAAGHAQRCRSQGRGVELHEPRRGRLGQHLAVVDGADPALPVNDGGPDAARPDIDDEDARGHDDRRMAR